jgi:hypothetical protein
MPRGGGWLWSDRDDLLREGHLNPAASLAWLKVLAIAPIEHLL